MTSTSSSGQSDDLSDQGDGASASGGIACRKGQRRRLWSPAEDERLLALVRKHGARDWAAIAAELGEARSSRSCRIRYVNQLSYSDTKRPFDHWEDAVVVLAQARFGNTWAKISKLLPGRSDNAIKNRFKCALSATDRKSGKKRQPLATNPFLAAGVPLEQLLEERRRLTDDEGREAPDDDRSSSPTDEPTDAGPGSRATDGAGPWLGQGSRPKLEASSSSGLNEFPAGTSQKAELAAMDNSARQQTTAEATSSSRFASVLNRRRSTIGHSVSSHGARGADSAVARSPAQESLTAESCPATPSTNADLRSLHATDGRAVSVQAWQGSHPPNLETDHHVPVPELTGLHAGPSSRRAPPGLDIAGTAGLDFACFGRARNSPHYAQQQPANVLLDTHVKDDDLIWVSGSDYAECDEIS